MKRTAALTLVLMLLAVGVSFGQEAQKEAAKPLTKQELLAYLERTGAAFQKAIHGLSEAQWNHKPAPEKWSVAEVAEHITLSESFFHGMAADALKKEPDPAAKSDPSRDAQFIGMYSDRSNPVQAPDFLRPEGKWKSRSELTDAFTQARQQNIQLMQQTDESSLRSHTAKFGKSTVDAQQIMLFMSAHVERHLKQIEEVKASPNFPKTTASN